MGAIGVLVDRSVSYAFSDPVTVLVLDGLAHELQADGFGPLLHAASSHPAGVEVVRSAAVDGWVVLERAELDAILSRHTEQEHDLLAAQVGSRFFAA